MKIHFLLLVLAFPYLSVCRDLKENMISPQFPPPPLPFPPPPSPLFTPSETLSFPPPPPLPLLPPEPDIPVTVCSPPPPPVPSISHCCVLVPPPARSTTPSFLQRLVASTFGRITIGFIVSVVGYVFYRVCRRPRDPHPHSHQSRVPRRQSSHHSESSSASRTTDRLPQPPPSPPRSEQCSSVMTPGLRDFIPDGFAIEM